MLEYCNWFLGLEEFKAFLSNTKTIILTIDLLHGLEYPTPFFSLENNPDGARATRGLLLQISAGLFILNYLISNKSNIFCSQKILFIFLLLLSLIMYKNALGRSDAPHIRDSTDMPILINCFFILNYILIFFPKDLFLIDQYFLYLFFFYYFIICLILIIIILKI